MISERFRRANDFMLSGPRRSWQALPILLVLMVSGRSPSAAEETRGEEVLAVPGYVTLKEPALDESSGLAFSGVRLGRVWSHNDSGGKPRLFAFDSANGRATGTARLGGISAVDWEDMATFRQDGVARVLVGDCGDNDAGREFVSLHLFDEPDPDRSTVIRDILTIRVRYPDGPRNCEAVAVDPVRGQIILVAKATLPPAGIYLVPLPPRNGGDAGTGPVAAGTISRNAVRAGSLALPMVTGMDVDPDTGDLWLSSYVGAYEFPCRRRGVAVGQQLSGLPGLHGVPLWKQIEAIAVERTGAIWITSEGAPTPLGRLRLESAE